MLVAYAMAAASKVDVKWRFTLKWDGVVVKELIQQLPKTR